MAFLSDAFITPPAQQSCGHATTRASNIGSKHNCHQPLRSHREFGVGRERRYGGTLTTVVSATSDLPTLPDSLPSSNDEVPTMGPTRTGIGCVAVGRVVLYAVHHLGHSVGVFWCGQRTTLAAGCRNVTDCSRGAPCGERFCLALCHL